MGKLHQIPIKPAGIRALGVDEPVVDGDGGQAIIDLDSPVIAQPSNACRPVMARPMINVWISSVPS